MKCRPLFVKLMPGLFHVFVFVVLAAALIGCGANKEQALIGKWAADADAMMKGAGSNEMAKSMAGAFAKSMSIEFKADKTFTMSMIFPAEGTWSLTGETVKLDVKTAMGMDLPADQKAQSNMEFTISDDGTTLTAIKKPDDAGQGQLVFKKEGG